MEIGNHPELYSLNGNDVRDVLVALGAEYADACNVVIAAQQGYARHAAGRWHVQVDHAGDGKFIVSVHAARASQPSLPGAASPHEYATPKFPMTRRTRS